MVDQPGAFKFETCLLKHHVRTNLWLPMAKQQLKVIREAAKSEKENRRLRYFTFCAVGAIDVLMLDLAKVVRKSAKDRFDTIFFFDMDEEHVAETTKRIPGAIGFTGDFVNTVLMDDPAEASIVDTLDALDAPESEPDEHATREKQRQLAARRQFIRSFPFDVLNLDLEEFLFKNHDPYPGRLFNALRKVFAWQKQPLPRSKGPDRSIDDFTFFFTTQIGPSNLGEDYQANLEGSLVTNLRADGTLSTLLNDRAGVDDVPTLRGRNFDLFFKLAMPKMLAAALMDADWYVDPEPGIRVFEFERESMSGPYKMLHLAMHVRRQEPPIERRGPRVDAPVATDAYRTVVRRVFTDPEEVVTLETIDLEALKNGLASVFARRKLYYPEDQPPKI